MADRVVLHIGTMKSGTSYLQGMLQQQAETLGTRGVLVPGRGRSGQVEALRQGQLAATGDRSLWEQTREELQAHPGDVVLSSELIGSAGRRALRNLLPDLAPARVDAVITMRDLNRILVSMWQETVQNGRTWSWDDYYAGVRADAPFSRTEAPVADSPGGRFWKQQDVIRMVRMWSEAIGVERLTVVACPPPGSDSSLLPRRFAEATGIPLDPHLPAPRDNASLGLPSVLMIRELNEMLEASGHAWPEGSEIRKRLLAKQVLAKHAADEPRLALRPSRWVRRQSAATVEALRASGVRFVGEWSDLDPVAVPGIQPRDVDQRQVTTAAIGALAGLISRQIRQGRRA